MWHVADSNPTVDEQVKLLAGMVQVSHQRPRFWFKHLLEQICLIALEYFDMVPDIPRDPLVSMYHSEPESSFSFQIMLFLCS